MGINFRSSFPEPKIPFGTVVFGLLYKYNEISNYSIELNI